MACTSSDKKNFFELMVFNFILVTKLLRRDFSLIMLIVIEQFKKR